MVLLVTQAVSCFLHHLGENMDRKSVSYSVQGSSSLKRFKAFNALGAIAFSFGDAMLPEIQVSDYQIIFDYSFGRFHWFSTFSTFVE